jgi:plastocyanin
MQQTLRWIRPFRGPYPPGLWHDAEGKQFPLKEESSMSRRIALVLALVAIVAGVVASVAVASSHSSKVMVQKVTVNMHEYRFVLVPKTIRAGKVTFTVFNKGRLVHNFDIQGVKATPVAGPGSKRVVTVTLKKGRYHYVCDVPRHAELGMAGKMIVR